MRPASKKSVPVARSPARYRAKAPASIALALALLMAGVAQAQGAAPTTGKVSEAMGDFRIEGYEGSRLRQIKFRDRTYRPLNAYEFIHVRALGPTMGGQPVLLAVSNDFMGVGTILIAVQNGTPLARVLSPAIDIRDPDLGLPQPDRQDVLLFTAGSRALVTSTGQVLWFEHLLPKEYQASGGMLVSVSPDNGSGALLLDNEIRLSKADDGVYARVPFTKAMQGKAFKPLWDESYAAARKTHGEGRRIDQRRLYDNLKAEWINRNFRWHKTAQGWQLRGQGLDSSPVLAQERGEVR
ncbi:hypothetical protein AXYL_03020 [Achromobacter xylosoxidans A8]|uniref:Uncharacterized protein n=1 Tax=Achromobacter xylosoxidans (strain A8) TaxID=762376 RepID=E3HW27_ACHXA|nr:hypothetical protein [Achromobacter xylosoxidans]ADP16340.1 hypothetical protein AXYL_03020 [Achromobacter xylosoxidans A8]